MALNVKTFRTRALTAIIFAACMLVGLLWNSWSFLILFSLIHFGCWWEYTRLLEKIHSTTIHPYVRLGIMLVGYGLMLFFADADLRISGYTLKNNFALPVSAAGFAMMIIGVFRPGTIKLKAFAAMLAGLAYISLAWGLMLFLSRITTIASSDRTYELPLHFIPLFIVATIWINDTMAYIVGSMIGKTPLSSISPKKTWEGTIGGILLSMIVAVVVLMLIFRDHPRSFFITWAIIAGVAAITGTIGDLFESWLKRKAGVKDSGSFMPGHGGFLDRFDSLLFATVFVFIYISLEFAVFKLM